MVPIELSRGSTAPSSVCCHNLGSEHKASQHNTICREGFQTQMLTYIHILRSPWPWVATAKERQTPPTGRSWHFAARSRPGHYSLRVRLAVNWKQYRYGDWIADNNINGKTIQALQYMPTLMVSQTRCTYRYTWFWWILWNCESASSVSRFVAVSASSS